jgi:hypothetical protein
VSRAASLAWVRGPPKSEAHLVLAGDDARRALWRKSSEAQNGACDLCAAVDGRFDRIGEVAIVVAKDAKIDAINIAGESFARDRIVERGKGGRSGTPDSRLGETRPRPAAALIARPDRAFGHKRNETVRAPV